MSTDHPDSEARQLVKTIYRLMAGRDYEGVLALMADDVMWCESEGSPMGGVHRGRDGVRRHVFARLARLFDDYHARPRQFIEDDDRICVLATVEGQCTATQEPIQMPVMQVWTIRGGEVARVQHCMDTFRLREALGAIPAADGTGFGAGAADATGAPAL